MELPIVTSREVSQFFKIGNPLEKMKLTQGFGENFNDFYKELGMKGHNGIDLRASMDTPARACMDGRITVCGADPTGGIEVRINSNAFSVMRLISGEEVTICLEAIYYHLQRFFIKINDHVKEGQIIAECDNTGRYTTGPHLHFGIKIYYVIGSKFYKDYGNGYFGAVDPAPLFREDPFLLPVDKRYGKPFNWVLEFMARFKTPKIHRELIKRGRSPLSITDRELKAIVYGNWDIDEILDPARFEYWSEHNKN